MVKHFTPLTLPLVLSIHTAIKSFDIHQFVGQLYGFHSPFGRIVFRLCCSTQHSTNLRMQLRIKPKNYPCINHKQHVTLNVGLFPLPDPRAPGTRSMRKILPSDFAFETITNSFCPKHHGTGNPMSPGNITSVITRKTWI